MSVIRIGDWIDQKWMTGMEKEAARLDAIAERLEAMALESRRCFEHAVLTTAAGTLRAEALSIRKGAGLP